MKSELLNMIDDQYKSSFVKQLEEKIDGLKLHNQVLIVGNDELDEENKRLKKEISMLEKLVELNMKDLWDIVDQRDWYYEEYQKLKEKSEQKIPQQKS
jgi:hypothetical protein